MRFCKDDALVVVDVQRDFCPGGALAIPRGEEVVPVVNRLIEEARAAGATVAASRDWHPESHISFRARGGPWPPHCVEGSQGALFHQDLRLPEDAVVVSKGMRRDSDQYSAFESTGLADLLRSRGVRRVTICGLALDVCVRASALDAAREGFETHVLRAATRPVNETSGEETIAELARAGVIVE